MIFGDWGTTRLRLFRAGADGAAERLDGPGIGQLGGSPAEALAETLAPWRAEARAGGLWLCGMAGSRNGLAEAPYVACPGGPEQWRAAAITQELDGVPVTIAPGLRAANLAGGPDVMRGEETQIFGALRREAALARGRHMLVLPGTHSKWAELVDGRIARFHSFMTGELFALLRRHSMLARAGEEGEEGREEGFAAGLVRAAGAGALAGLFEARSAQLLDGRGREWALGFVSGLLIGGEIGDALRLAGEAPESITLIGDPALATLYARALEASGRAAALFDGEVCALMGLRLLAEGGMTP